MKPARRYDARRLQVRRKALAVQFGLGGLMIATWLSRSPAVRDLLGAGPAEMGLLAFAMALGAIGGLGISSAVIAAVGPRRTIGVGMAAMPVALAVTGVLVTVGGSVALAALPLAGFGFLHGLCDVALNVDGAGVERELGRTLMPQLHGAFSFGTMAGAGSGAVAEALGVPVAAHCAAVSVLSLAASLAALRNGNPGPTPGTGPPASPAGPSRPGRRAAVWLEPRTLLIGLIVLGMAFAEGAANDWLPLAMVDGRGVSYATGAFLLGLFLTAMTVGRMAGGAVLDTFGRVRVLQGSAALAAVGLLTVVFVPIPLLIGAGVVLWGLGSALGFPIGMSAAADDVAVAPERVSAVATVGYVAFMAGPPLIGFLGEEVGLLRALAVVLVLVALSSLVSGAAAPSRRPGDSPAS